jgi:hypothetical protein
MYDAIIFALLTWCVKEADGLGCAVHINIHVVRTNSLATAADAAADAAAAGAAEHVSTAPTSHMQRTGKLLS